MPDDAGRHTEDGAAEAWRLNRASASKGSPAAMRVRLRLRDPELVDDLLDFLRQRECAGEQVEGSQLLEVALPQTLQRNQAQMELDLLLRVWELMHPGTSVDVVR